MLRLFTTFYPEPDPARRAEYAECLARNLSLPFIDEICLLIEGDLPPFERSPKLRFRQIPVRPLYDDFFAWINELASPEDISVIANTDILFNGSLLGALHFLRSDECYALSRWVQKADGSARLFDRNDSQDAWIFRGSVVSSLFGNFPLGVPRCDNRLLHELFVAGYTVRNPAFSIRIYHLHAGDHAEYSDGDFPGPPYRYLFPHNLLNWAQTSLHNLRQPAAKLGWRFDRRRFEGILPLRILRRVGRLFNSWKMRNSVV